MRHGRQPTACAVAAVAAVPHAHPRKGGRAGQLAQPVLQLLRVFELAWDRGARRPALKAVAHVGARGEDHADGRDRGAAAAERAGELEQPAGVLAHRRERRELEHERRVLELALEALLGEQRAEPHVPPAVHGGALVPPAFAPWHGRDEARARRGVVVPAQPREREPAPHCLLRVVAGPPRLVLDLQRVRWVRAERAHRLQILSEVAAKGVDRRSLRRRRVGGERRERAAPHAVRLVAPV